MANFDTGTSTDTIGDLAALANRAAYDTTTPAAEIEGSPHRRHAVVRARYARLAAEVFARARSFTPVPHVLDLGAGDGAVTRTFLELGARVTAADVSAHQLAVLAERNHDFADRLAVATGDAAATLDALRRDGTRFDIVTAVSFLHHIPNYLPIVEAAVDLLEPHGQLFVFQDPMRADTLTTRNAILARIAYAAWRIRRPDAAGGIRRYLRRRRGVWLDDCAADNVEYHELRGGVDQHAIVALLGGLGFETRVVYYFATQSPLWQRIGERLGARNKFALVAYRSPASTS